MKIKFKLLIVLSLIISTSSHAKDNYFDEAKKLFIKEKYDESKFLFQRDIVFNPKNSHAYYFLENI